jgi:glycosyltransferase involved in cell wall biosynthesis
MIYTNFKLPADGNKKIDIHYVESVAQLKAFTVDIWRMRGKLSALLIANPNTKFLMYLGVLRFLRVVNCPVFLFDLILKRPNRLLERLIAKIKGIFIAAIDYIFVIHKDTSGYESFYGLRRRQFIYVPFKANNFEKKDQFPAAEGDYVVAMGASQRDYETLVAAARYTEIKIIIVCSDEGAVGNNAKLGDVNNYPPNVIRIKENLDFHDYYQLLAQSKFVVIPILQSAIQPAGISVYLESMILKKAVIVSEGASTNYILQNNKDAILVLPSNPELLGDAINRLILNDELRKSIEISGYEYAFSLGGNARLRENIRDLILQKINQ